MLVCRRDSRGALEPGRVGRLSKGKQRQCQSQRVHHPTDKQPSSRVCDLPPEKPVQNFSPKEECLEDSEVREKTGRMWLLRLVM